MKSALIIVDMQYDFCDGGPMSNNNSLNIIPKINSIRDDYSFVIFLVKLCPSNHVSFKYYGGKYPKHCVENMSGSEIVNDIIKKPLDVVVTRCTLQQYDSKSGFYNAEIIEKPTNLKYILQVNSINKLYFCGNNMETTIFSTVMDALNYNFECYIIRDVVGYIDINEYNEKIKFLNNLNVEFI
jgi:nicotinamidase/pyrazinamidase